MSHIHTLLVVCASCYAALARDGMHMCVHMTHVNVCTIDLCMYTHTQGAFPVSHIRLMRAFRIIRIFGQLKAIKSIVNAITASINAVLNAFFIITLAPIFAMLWIFLAKKGLEPSTPVKFALGIIQAGLGFGALVYGHPV